MRVLVVGLGSMGKRRIRLLKQKYADEVDIIGVDLREDRRIFCQEEYNIMVFSSLEDVLDKFDIKAAFICTSPLSHGRIINKCLNKGIHVFSELNLIADEFYHKNIKLAEAKKCVLFASSTLLYRKDIEIINEYVVNLTKPVNYIYHVGQYLPDWHPWEDYKDFFVADRRTNACREIMAIEFPWIIEVFGEIDFWNVFSDKMSGLDIEYNDNFFIFIKHRTGNKGLLEIDLVSRKAVRNLEVFGEELYLSWDGKPEGLRLYDFTEGKEKLLNVYPVIDRNKGYSEFIVENAYMREIEIFFEAVAGKKELVKYDINKEREVINLMDKIEGRVYEKL